jgi:excisionase family DNA binding protein
MKDMGIEMAETSKVLTVPQAGAQLGLGRNASYEAAKRGDIPTIRLGKLLRVPKVAFDRLLDGSPVTGGANT